MKLGTIQLWSLLPEDKRRELIVEKGIKRSGDIEVENNRIVSDGVLETDLEGKIEAKEIEEMLGINRKDVSVKEVKKIKKKKHVKQPEKKIEEKAKELPSKESL